MSSIAEMIEPKKNLTLNELSLIELKIENNTAKAEEYEILDKALSSFGVENYIYNFLKSHQINGYEDFISKRNTINGSVNLEGEIVGYILGVIPVLKRILSNQL